MTGRKIAFVCLGGVSLLALLLSISLAQQAGAVKPPAETSELLGGADRFLTHVSTDKPIYRPGEKLYLRGVTLNARTNQPSTENLPAVVEIIGPKGDVVASGRAGVEEGILGFSWDISDTLAGGQYKAKVTRPWSGDAPAERSFEIRAYRAPRLRSQIKFLRDGYGPADDVVATLEVTRAEGGIPAGAKVAIVVRIDGEESFRGESNVDAAGHCVARFKLPAEIARGEGSLAMVVEDGGVVETASKTIPILLQTVDLSVYPEGGDLIAGVPNRVYFEAFTPAHKPADLAGVVLDSDGKEVATFRSEHEGRGRFAFTPKADQTYTLAIQEPAGIHTTYPLPEIKVEGVAITSLDDVSGEKVRLQLLSAGNQTVSVTLNKREQELSRREVKLTGGQPTEIEMPSGEASGVLVATVKNGDGKPLAERLVFSRPRKEVRINIASDRPRYVPGGKAVVTITTTDESDKPMSALVGLTVTDDSVLEMIERREQAPRLPVMVLLESDVKDLADAQIYLDPENAQAPAAIDLLLGTQGWRRFAMVDVAKFLEKNGDPGRRVLALRMPKRSEIWSRSGGGFGGGDGENLRLFGEVDRVKDGIPRGLLLANRPARAAAEDGADQKALEDNGALAAFDVEASDELAIAGDKPALEPAGQVVPAAAPVPAAEAGREQLFAALDKEEESERRLGPLGGAREAFGIGDRFAAKDKALRSDFVMVRVFAHHVRPERQPGERTDFAETLFWHAGLKTDEAGKATFEFDLNDAVTSFRVFADAFASSGALGSGTAALESVEPFYVEPKLPLEVTTGDVVQLPIGLVNGTDTPLETSLIANFAGNTAGDGAATVKLSANGRGRHLVSLPIGTDCGTTEVMLSATATPYRDNVTRTMQVKPLGFPVERGRGGLIEAGGAVTHDVEIPETLVTGSLRTKAVVYPTPLASMTQALERLIQEPCGCFEQTSSTVYPLVMAQQYFLDHQGVDPKLIERSATILDEGYKRLVGFEAKSGGYEWFGNDPGHDALTAYGLLEFTDMCRVRAVDPQMLARTKKWFLEQRDGKGGFARKTQTLHTWLPDAEVANAYNTWALFEAGVEGDFATEVKWLREAAEVTQNTYVVALAANVLAEAGDKDGTARLLDKLAGKQNADGSLSGATVSVVGSTGDALAIETTSLAVLAWLHDGKYAEQVEKAIQFLAESCKAGRFGSTQSTVLALRAITAYDRSRAVPGADGQLQLMVDEQPVGEPVAFTTDTKGAIEMPDFAAQMTPGRHKVELQMTDGSRMPFSIAVNYFATKPDTSAKCKLDLTVALFNTQVAEGELTEAKLSMTNRADEAVPSPIAIVGIPGGLEVRHDRLKELVKEGRIAAYEVLGRDLVLYWRSLSAGEHVEVPVSVVAAIPGHYTGPASRAYLYYTDEDKKWVDGLSVDIMPRGTEAK